MALVQGNTKSRIRATITKPDGSAWDLTGYLVTFRFKKPLTKAAMEIVATAEDAANGIYYVDTDADTLDEPGEWELQAKLDDQVDAVTYSYPGVEFEVGQLI